MKIGQIELGKRAVVVGTLVKNIDTNSEKYNQIDVFELRLDLFSRQDVEINNYNKPLIATVRSKKEGSPNEIDDEKRFEIYEKVASSVDAIDVELSSYELTKKVLPLCRQNNILLISSYHNFEQTPEMDELEEILSKGKAIGADIVKIAAYANSKDDLARLMEFTIKNKNASVITISLGEIGLISRIANPSLGSLMTYGFVQESTAPGQISALEIVKQLIFFAAS